MLQKLLAGMMSVSLHLNLCHVAPDVICKMMSSCLLLMSAVCLVSRFWMLSSTFHKRPRSQGMTKIYNEPWNTVLISLFFGVRIASQRRTSAKLSPVTERERLAQQAVRESEERGAEAQHNQADVQMEPVEEHTTLPPGLSEFHSDDLLGVGTAAFQKRSQCTSFSRAADDWKETSTADGRNTCTASALVFHVVKGTSRRWRALVVFFDSELSSVFQDCSEFTANATSCGVLHAESPFLFGRRRAHHRSASKCTEAECTVVAVRSSGARSCVLASYGSRMRKGARKGQHVSSGAVCSCVHVGRHGAACCVMFCISKLRAYFVPLVCQIS